LPSKNPLEDMVDPLHSNKKNHYFLSLEKKILPDWELFVPNQSKNKFKEFLCVLKNLESPKILKGKLLKIHLKIYKSKATLNFSSKLISRPQ
jgi:hypothetical protein